MKIHSLILPVTLSAMIPGGMPQPISPATAEQPVSFSQ